MPAIPTKPKDLPDCWVNSDSYTTNSSIYLEIAYYMFYSFHI